MPERNVVPWTVIIECYSRWSNVDSGFVMFNRMRAEGVAPSAVTLLGPSLLLVAAFLLVCTAYEVASDGSDHRYKAGDPVPPYANKTGPFHNPSETYRYFDLPFCSPAHITEKKEALGEVLNGDRLLSAPYKLDFLKDKDSETVCKKTLSKEEIAKFRDAVNKDFYFQMYYDDLPIWGFIGKVDKEGKLDPSEYKYYLYKHLHFEISYNKDRVVEINAQTNPSAVVDVTDDKEVDVQF